MVRHLHLAVLGRPLPPGPPRPPGLDSSSRSNKKTWKHKNCGQPDLNILMGGTARWQLQLTVQSCAAGSMDGKCPNKLGQVKVTNGDLSFLRPGYHEERGHLGNAKIVSKVSLLFRIWWWGLCAGDRWVFYSNILSAARRSEEMKILCNIHNCV